MGWLEKLTNFFAKYRKTDTEQNLFLIFTLIMKMDLTLVLLLQRIAISNCVLAAVKSNYSSTKFTSLKPIARKPWFRNLKSTLAPVLSMANRLKTSSRWILFSLRLNQLK